LSRLPFLIAGYILTGIGIVGFVTPGLPGTVFLIAALACFRRGSPRMEAWLLNHKLFGPTLTDWQNHRWMPLRIKVFSISCIVLGVLGTLMRPSVIWEAKALLLVLGLIGITSILRLQTKPAQPSN